MAKQYLNMISVYRIFVLFDKGILFLMCCLQDIMLHSRAFWVSKDTIAWKTDAGDGLCRLYGSKNATLFVENGNIRG